jgi:hypothetical protein
MSNPENPVWTYRGKLIESHDALCSAATDFVYLITFTSGHRYIGKKTFRALRKLPPKKSQLKIRKNFVRREMVNVPFLKYQGSIEHAIGLVAASKEILYLCSDKKAATYIETALLFQVSAIFDERYVNKNISGRFYDNDLKGLLEFSDTSYKSEVELEWLT